eukprot:10441081-Alexandrium_andersonii.AAC.1
MAAATRRVRGRQLPAATAQGWAVALSTACRSPGALCRRRLGQYAGWSVGRMTVAERPHGRLPVAYWSLRRGRGLLA